MRDHSTHIVMTREGLVDSLLENNEFEPQTEVVKTGDALGRVLAKDALSAIEKPNALTCNMDSVALRWSDFEGRDDVDEDDWSRGVEWEFANTGVAMPEGFDTALRIESVEVYTDANGNERIELLELPEEKGEGTTAPGARLTPGDVVVEAGTVLSAYDLASMIGAGILEVEVVKRPIVAFIPTGNELVAPTATPPIGKNIDSNSTLISALVREWGGEPLMYDIVPDDRDKIEAALIDACANADIVVINGGSSKGSDDWTIEVLEELGDVYCHETNKGPGKHASASKVSGTVVLGLSGPPKGAVVTTEIFLKPLIDEFLGIREVDEPCEESFDEKGWGQTSDHDGRFDNAMDHFAWMPDFEMMEFIPDYPGSDRIVPYNGGI